MAKTYGLYFFKKSMAKTYGLYFLKKKVFAILFFKKYNIMLNLTKSETESFDKFTTTEPNTVLIATSSEPSKYRFKTISKLINWLESSTNKSINTISELDSIHLLVLQYVICTFIIYFILQSMNPKSLQNKQKQIIKSKSLLVSMILSILVCSL